MTDDLDALAAQFGGVPVGNIDSLAQKFGGKIETPGFLERVGEDLSKRSQISGEINSALQRGEQGPAESGFQQLGKVYAGGVNDIVGEGLQSLINYTPESLKQPIKGALASLADTQVGRAVTGAGQGALAAYGRFAEDNPRAARNIESAANILPFVTPIKGKTVAGAMGDTASTTGRNIARSATEGVENIAAGITARSPDVLDYAANVLRQKSSDIYKIARESGAVTRADSATNIFNKVQNAVESSGKLNKDLHRNTLSVLKDMKTGLKKDIGLEELEQYRTLLSDVVNSGTDISGKLNADAFKASRAIDSLDEAIDGIQAKDLLKGDTAASKAFQEARGQWKKYRKFDSVANVVRKSGGDPYLLKSNLTKLVNNKKNLRGFTTEEKKALINASQNTTIEKILKNFGKFGFDLGTDQTKGNTFLPVLGSIAGATGVPAAAPLVLGGTAARTAQKVLARGKIEKALKLIEEGR